jgi:hypothetical protein
MSSWRAFVRAGAYVHAGTRVAIGTAFLVAPRHIAAPWLGPTVSTPGGTAALRAFAIRDVILGAGTVAALHTHTGARRWFRLGLLAEGVDVPAALIAARRGSGASAPGAMTVVGALGFAGGLFLSVALAEDD